MTPASKLNHQQRAGRAPSGWVCLLYFSVTVLVNLSVLAMWPKFVRPAIAAQCLAFAVIPIVWGVYLPFRCRSSAAAWSVSGSASLGALGWLYFAAEVVLLLR